MSLNTQNREQRVVASERKGLQHGSETFYDMWFGDGGTKKTTGNQRTGGRAKDAEIFLRATRN